MPTRISVVLFALFFSLSGCGQDYNLAPPPDSEQMTVTVKIPKELKARTLEVMYRSSICKRIKTGSSGQRIEVEGYHGIYVQLQRQGQSDLYVAKLPKDGGGDCQWHLSNILFGVTYGAPTQFGGEVTSGTGGGVIVMFDHNRPLLSSGLPIKVEGDLTIRKDYYPWLHERFLGGYDKYVNLASEGSTYPMYQALRAREVYFEAFLYSDFLVTSEGAKAHKVSDFIKFTYPDGSVLSDSSNKPNFRKLQTIRLASEGK